MTNNLSEDLLEKTKIRFLEELRHHFQGWLAKISRDFSDENFKLGLKELENDPVYKSFGFAIPEYVLIRLMGRVSISIGRRLGEIYDKIPRFVTQARFNLSRADVAPLISDKLELDICVPNAKISSSDKSHVKKVVSDHLPNLKYSKGIGIEIRYNFNPNDSSRLRKDVDMVRFLNDEGLGGIYLIFSTISPRDEAIARLTRAGWHFLVGDAATAFINDLIGLNIDLVPFVRPV